MGTIAAAIVNLDSQVMSAVRSLTTATPPSISGSGGPVPLPNELWPIQVQKDINTLRKKLNPMGDPAIEKYYHEALEQGRLCEKSIADAQHWLNQKQALLFKHIQHWLGLNTLAVDGKLSDKPRAVRYTADSLRFLQQINQFQKEIVGLIQAVTTNIGILVSMMNNMVGMIQANLNALAALMAEICNWGLPKIPALPNFFKDTIWHFNGFNFFPLAMFKMPHLSLANFSNFSFAQCNMGLPSSPNGTPAINTLTPPDSMTTQDGLTFGTPLFVPPLGGLTTDAAAASTPAVPLSNTTIPIIDPTVWNADATPMWGAVPDPATIVSAYEMPAAVYSENIVSIVPSLRSNTIESTDSDYSNPNYTTRNAALRVALVENITLANVVASNYDPYITSAWLIYLNTTRTSRLGNWIQNFEVQYATSISPSLVALSNVVPWNNTVSVPTPVLPLVSTLTTMETPAKGNLLWRLSYIEAALLGYTRCQLWDGYADTTYLSGYTGANLDYVASTISSATTTVLLGDGQAEYPVSCTYPSSISGALQQVITMANTNIVNTLDYQSKQPRFRYIYNQFAEAVEVDRFSQFWREFNSNLQSLLAKDPYLVQFVVTYPASLDSAIDPLGSPVIFNNLNADAASRNRTWVPGYSLLNLPIAPPVVYMGDGSDGSNGYTGNASGWNGDLFDPTTFLERPDVQALSIPEQMAMVSTNQTYASLLLAKQDMLDTAVAQITNSQAVLTSLLNMGFKVESSGTTVIPVGSMTTSVVLDVIDYDLTNNATSPTSFTMQAAGSYAVAGQLNWSSGDAGTRTVTVLQNGVAIMTASIDTNTDPIQLPFSTTASVAIGDIITLEASHNLTTAQQITTGSYLTVMQYDPDQSAAQLSTSSSNTLTGTVTFTADAAIPALTAVQVGLDGKVTILNPTVIATDSNGVTLAPLVDGITTAAVAAGGQVSAANAYGGVYQVSGASFTIGGLLYVGSNGVLTQDFTSVQQDCSWVICVGRATATDTFIYTPQLPNRVVLTF